MKDKGGSIRRRSFRASLTCRVFFFGDSDFEGEARMLDCSTNGCRLISDISVTVGQELRLSLFLSDHPWPLKIESAVVRWIAEPEFGLEFISIRSSLRKRLRALLMKAASEQRILS